MNIIIMLLLISVLILVHEMGHYLAARFFGVRVEKFGFGLPFGPTLFKTKWGETEILVHAFLLGGYVAFPDDEDSCLEKECECEDKKDDSLPSDSPLRFKNKTRWQKAIIISAGVIANMIFAVFLVYSCAAIWGKLPSGKYDISVKEIVNAPKNQFALLGGKNGDKIVSINGQEVDSSFKFIMTVQKSKSYDGLSSPSLIQENLKLLKTLNPKIGEESIIKKGQSVKLPESKTETPEIITRNVALGVKKYQNDEVELNTRQKELRDSIIDKEEFVAQIPLTLEDIAYAISDNYKPVDITISRNGKLVNIENLKVNRDGLIGLKLESQELYAKTKNPVEIFKASNRYIVDNTKLMVLGLAQLVSGKVPLGDLHGIVAITKIGGDIIEHKGMFEAILLTAIISIDLAIINLVPIPALDGGHLLFLLIEKITGRPLKQNVVEIVAQIGFFFLIALMIYIIFNDISALMTNKI